MTQNRQKKSSSSKLSRKGEDIDAQTSVEPVSIRFW